jgi:hypothetical protein
LRRLLVYSVFINWFVFDLVFQAFAVSRFDNETPDAAVSVLGKGLGFVPTPSLNVEDARLDMRLTTNRILNTTKSSGNTAALPNDRGPSKLFRKYYGPKSPALEQAVNEIMTAMSQDLDSKLRRKTIAKSRKSNLSKDELSGLKWLEEKTKDNQICVVEADKGGAILIVYLDLPRKMTLEKLKNPSLYSELTEDPTHTLHKQLFDKWVEGKSEGLVSAATAKDIKGVSDNLKKVGTGPKNRPSTQPHFKPGISYFYPSLKIYKLQKDQ